MRRVAVPATRRVPVPAATAVLVLALALALAGCGAGTPPRAGSGAGQPEIPAALAAGMRPIGVGVRFHPPVRGRPTGACERTPGSQVAHLELFGANRVVLIPAGVGHVGGCFGSTVTLDPTGTVYFRPGASLADLFRAWGQPLSATRMASFRGPVRFYLDGRPVSRRPALRQHAEIVLEVGPYVPPHRRYTFPRGL